MAPWIRIDVGIDEHPKTLALRDFVRGSSAEEIVGYLVRLLGRVSMFRPSGYVGDITPAALEQWAGWRGEPGSFADGFTQFFVSDGVITGWAKRNGTKLAKEESDRLRKRRGRSAETPRNVRGSSAEDLGTIRDDTIHTTSSTTATARETLEAAMRPQSRVRFKAECDMLLAGAHLPAGLRATEPDLDLACADWLQSNPDTLPTAIVFRTFVARAIRERQGNASPNGQGARKLSVAEQAYANAGQAVADLPEGP